MGEGKTSMFGKTYNTIGSADSNFIIKTKGDLKIQWGNKFIDVIKNGKLASAGSDILKVVSNPDDISNNGIYLVPTDNGNEVWVSIDGTKVNLAGEIGTSYVSFLAEQKEVTPDLKYIALTNAGLYYETLEEAQLAGIKAGIIFIVGENKLYLANNGLLSEYIISANSSENSSTNTLLDEITIKDLRIYSNGTNMVISSPNLQFNINDLLAISLDNLIKSYLDIVMLSGTYILSANATSTSGYRLYMKNGKSVLEIDSIIWRDMNQSLKNTTELNSSIVYSLSENIIQSAYLKDTNIVCTLKYPNSFLSTDKVYILIPLSVLANVGYELDGNNVEVYANIGKVIATLDVEIQVNYTADSIKGSVKLTIPKGSSSTTYTLSSILDFMIDNYTVISGPPNVNDSGVYGKKELVECEIVESKLLEITISMDSPIRDLFLTNYLNSFICLSNVPLIKITLNNLDVLDRSKTITNQETSETKIDETIHTRIGVVKELDFEALKSCPTVELEAVLVGIYSDNFIGLNSKLYDTIFKKRCDYPKYDTTIEIPEDFDNEKYNNTIPNINWIKELIKLTVPSGTIAMFYGKSPLPEGWAICDGTNGTPNLVGKFIKAVSTTDLIGENTSDLNENNELTLTREHLPEHSHPHEAHTHILGGNGTTNYSGDLGVTFNYSNYNYGIQSSPVSVITSVSGEGVTSESGLVGEVSNIGTLGGYATGGDHYHSISLNSDSGILVLSSTSVESTQEWTNKPIKIEPRSYSLIFIMKL